MWLVDALRCLAYCEFYTNFFCYIDVALYLFSHRIYSRCLEKVTFCILVFVIYIFVCQVA